MTQEEASRYLYQFWQNCGVKSPSKHMVDVLSEKVVALDEAGFADLDPIVLMLYKAYLDGYQWGKDGKRL